MTRVSFRKRDGLARTGTLETEGMPQVRLPAVTNCRDLFPALDSLAGTNIPLCASAAIARQFPPKEGIQPVTIHPQLDNHASSGDCVMVAGWHTAMANPRTYVEWLIGLKEKTPVDTAWYAPASALPSTVAILCYSGFDLFDYTAADLKSAQGRFVHRRVISRKMLLKAGSVPARAAPREICGTITGMRCSRRLRSSPGLLRRDSFATSWNPGAVWMQHR